MFSVDWDFSWEIKTYLKNWFPSSGVDCLLEYCGVVGLFEECWGQIINIVDTNDNCSLRLINPVMRHQTQVVLKQKENMRIKQNIKQNW